MDPYFSTNERQEAVDSLTRTAEFLERVAAGEQMWKWAIIALHHAVQGFMVLALQGTWPVTTLHRDQRKTRLQAECDFHRAREAGDDAAAEAANQIMLDPGNELAAFKHLYARVKDPDGIMRRYINSSEFEPRSTDDQCMECLNTVRNEFMHFQPQTRNLLLTRFPAMTEAGLHLIDFLLNSSHAIDWMPWETYEDEAREALDRAQEALTNIQRQYEGLALPAAPLCGSPIATSTEA